MVINMTFKISVPDMHCDGCVNRINKALSAADLKFSVLLDEKTVTVDGCEHCLKTALTELEDLGFSPNIEL